MTNRMAQIWYTVLCFVVSLYLMYVWQPFLGGQWGALTGESAERGDILIKILSSSGPTKLRWDLSAEEIHSLSDALIEHSASVYDSVAAAKSNPTWDTTLQLLADDDALFSTISTICTFPTHVSTDRKVRDAAMEADKKMTAFSVDAAMRYDVYEAVLAFSQTEEAKALEGESLRLLERVMRNHKRKGMQLAEEKRDLVKQTNKRMADLSIQFAKNLGEVDRKLPFNAADLEGLPEDYLSRLSQDPSGRYLVTLKTPDVLPIMKKCKVSATRKAVLEAYDSRCMEENTPIIEELVQLRFEAAQMLGYPTHAHFVTEVRMAKTPEAVRTFLEDLSQRLTPLQEAEMAVFSKLKIEETRERGEDDEDGKLNSWDLSYYRNMVEERQYQIDHDAIKEYFPLEVVVAGMFDIYQEMLGLRFEEEEELTRTAWHQEVKAFQVTDSATGELMGFFYLDLHPREGKYGHAAVFGLQPGCDSNIAKAGRLVPVAACVTNFPKSSPGRPSLLPHSDVVTFFHEFGHVMHRICARAHYQMFEGTKVERDFVETPSQMLENWTWEEEALRRMSGHYQDTSKPLPTELTQVLANSRNANAGVLYKRQLTFALFDQYIHSQPQVDTAAEYARFSRDIMKVDMVPGTNFVAQFNHLAGGYDAQYYGYLWSEVFSADMYATRFKQEGIFSEKVGRDYREKILQPGGSREGEDMLRDFLGREPSMNAFLEAKGLVPQKKHSTL